MSRLSRRTPPPHLPPARASDDARWRPAAPIAATFAAIGALAAVDLGLDLRAGASLGHLVLELLLVTVALAAASLFVRQWRRDQRLAASRLEALTEATAESQRWQAEAERWRGEARELMSGLARMLDEQFDRWQLTAAEREVALLLLKGLSTKEIAQVREVSDRTVRQQAQAVYAKGGVAGRAELSAFFLEDLLLPRPALPETPASDERGSAD